MGCATAAKRQGAEHMNGGPKPGPWRIDISAPDEGVYFDGCPGCYPAVGGINKATLWLFLLATPPPPLKFQCCSLFQCQQKSQGQTEQLPNIEI